jgi:hypothetical protein
VLFIALAAGAADLLGAQSARTNTIKSVRITRSGDLWTVALEADGPLPAPKIGELEGPPRVYLDFENVRTAVNNVAGETGAPVVRVRAAVHSRAPLITRVVVDLASKQPIRTEADQLEAGRFRVLIGTVAPDPVAVAKPERPPPATAAVETPIAPVPLLPPLPAAAPSSAPAAAAAAASGTTPPDPAGTSSTVSSPGISPLPARSTTPPVPPKDADRYLEQIGSALTRYRKLRSMLASIDREEDVEPADLPAARQQFAAVLRTLTAHRASDSVKATHDLLVRSVSFALMAATLRADAGTRADPEKLRNAASAAAGALLLLDRVCGELNCPELQQSENTESWLLSFVSLPAW